MGDTVVDYSHNGGCFGELRMGFTPVRKLSFTKSAETLLAANRKS
jgi:hypothetical protein